jgi:hypothetical protein
MTRTDYSEVIWIEEYRRIRNGRIEQVCGHWRRKRRRLATVIPFPHPSVA